MTLQQITRGTYGGPRSGARGYSLKELQLVESPCCNDYFLKILFLKQLWPVGENPCQSKVKMWQGGSSREELVCTDHSLPSTACAGVWTEGVKPVSKERGEKV